MWNEENVCLKRNGSTGSMSSERKTEKDYWI